MKEIPDINRCRQNTPWSFFCRLFSRRMLRRSLLGLAGLVTLATLGFTGENWRGEQAWEHCKQSLAARGETLDWAAYIPAPVPDEQNILKAPNIAEWFGDNRGTPAEAPLDHPMTNDFARSLFNVETARQITSAEAANSYLSWSDQFQDDFNLISQALKRPYARTITGYSQISSITFVNAVTLGTVVRVLEQRAKCHLLLGQTDQAWKELTLLLEMRRLVDTQGKFITTEGDWMVRGIMTHGLAIIARGLELHAWNEPQLLALQAQLKDSNLLSLHADALRCARALLLTSFENGDLFRALKNGPRQNSQKKWLRPVSLLPDGVSKELCVRMAQNCQEMIDAYDVTNGIVRPADVSRASAWWKRALAGTPGILWAQTIVNEGQIACALERYRVAKGAYPETLDPLVPQFMNQLPHDIINGEPLKYHKINDGNFLLYSVGWDETDQGGMVISVLDGPESAKEGDWVWNVWDKQNPKSRL